MTSTSFPSAAPAKARLPKLSPRLWLCTISIPATAITADVLMRHIELPFWLRVPVALAPLVPGAFFLRELARSFARADELALHIAREALAFVFFGLIGVMICVDLLRNAGVLPGFVWSTATLLIAMVALALVGTWFASRRYR